MTERANHSAAGFATASLVVTVVALAATSVASLIVV